LGADNSDRDSPGEKTGAMDQTWESLVHKHKCMDRRRPNKGSAPRAPKPGKQVKYCFLLLVVFGWFGFVVVAVEILISNFNIKI